MHKRVAVLMGGVSAEREVSLETGESIAEALVELGHEAIPIDVGRDLATRLELERVDVAFMALHGRGGEDGTVQGLLEVMRIPYTGCGVLASAITMDKVVTKQILGYHGITVAEDVVAAPGDSSLDVALQVESELGFPVMVKPSCEGSSIGVTRVDEAVELKEALNVVFQYDERALIERYVSGRLLTVGLIGKEPVVLPVLEIETPGGFYDYRAKYDSSSTEYRVPAEIEPDSAMEVQRIALESFKALRCEDISRIDFILEQDTGAIYLLEINTIPGMTSASLIPKAASAVGIGFNEVVRMVLEGARLKVSLEG